MAQETISDWADDYGGLDTNTPQGGDTVEITGDGTLNDKAFQEPKAVIREESLNKGFEPDTVAITRINSRTFEASGVDLRDRYSPGDTVYLYAAGGGGDPEVSGTLEGVLLLGGDTRFTLIEVRAFNNDESSIPLGVDTARFSAWRSRFPVEVMRTFPAIAAVQLPSFVPRVFQATTITIAGTNIEGSAYLPFDESSDDYYVSAQFVSTSGSPATGSLLIRRITKSADSVRVRLCAAPGTGATVAIEVQVYQHIGGSFVE